MTKFIKLFFDITQLETTTNGKFLKVKVNDLGAYIFTFSNLLGVKNGKTYLVIPTSKEYKVFHDKEGTRTEIGKIKGEEIIKSKYCLGEYKNETKQTKTIEII